MTNSWETTNPGDQNQKVPKTFDIPVLISVIQNQLVATKQEKDGLSFRDRDMI